MKSKLQTKSDYGHKVQKSNKYRHKQPQQVKNSDYGNTKIQMLLQNRPNPRRIPYIKTKQKSETLRKRLHFENTQKKEMKRRYSNRPEIESEN